MAWEIVRIEDKFNLDGKPFISISRERFFCASFVRLVEIGTTNRVIIHSGAETLRLGFEFHNDEKPNSLALVQDGKSKTKKSGLFCSSCFMRPPNATCRRERLAIE